LKGNENAYYSSSKTGTKDKINLIKNEALNNSAMGVNP